MGTMGQSLIYVCDDKAYDNELAMCRYEGIASHRRGAAAPVFEARPRFAYCISLGGAVHWSTDPVDACRTRRQTPDASIDLAAVRR